MLPCYKDRIFDIAKNKLRLITDIHNDGETFISSDGVCERSLMLMRPTSCNVIKTKDIKLAKYAENQQCHAIAAYEWLNDPTLRLVLGFSYYEYAWYMHSFLVDKNNVVIEPTPLKREIYWGRFYTREETLYLVADELNNIRKLYLPITDKHIKLLTTWETR